MENPPQQFSRLECFSILLTVGLIFFSAHEGAPSWAWYRPVVPDAVNYGISIVLGSMSGALVSRRYRIPGLVGGGLLGFGLLFGLTILMLDPTFPAFGKILVVLSIASAPGVSAYFVVKTAQDFIIFAHNFVDPPEYRDANALSPCVVISDRLDSFN